MSAAQNADFVDAELTAVTTALEAHRATGGYPELCSCGWYKAHGDSRWVDVAHREHVALRVLDALRKSPDQRT